MEHRLLNVLHSPMKSRTVISRHKKRTNYAYNSYSYNNVKYGITILSKSSRKPKPNYRNKKRLYPRSAIRDLRLAPTAYDCTVFDVVFATKWAH